MKRQSRGPKSGKSSGKKSGGRFEKSDRPSKKYGDEPRKERSGPGKYSRDDKDSYKGKSDRKSSDRNERSERPKYGREGSSNRSERSERSDRPEGRNNRDDRGSSYKGKSDRKPYERKERSDRNERSDRPERRSSRDDGSSAYKGKSDRKPYERKSSDRPKFDRSEPREGSSNRSERSERSDRPEGRNNRDDRGSAYKGKSDRKPYERKERSDRSERSDRPKYGREGSSSRSERGERSDRPERRSSRDDGSSAYKGKSDRKPYERKSSDRPKFDRSEPREGSSRRGGEERSERPERRSSRDDSSSFREKSDRKPFGKREPSSGPKFDRSEPGEEKSDKIKREDEPGEKTKRPRTKRSDADPEEKMPYLKKEFRDDDHFSFNKYKKEKKNLARSAEGYNKMVKKSSKKKDEPRNDDGTVRLNKYIANAGVCSRREADELIQTGVIKVNGKIVTELGTKILPTDKVQYGDQTLSQEKMVYVLLNKPKDYITTTDDPEKRRTVMELVQNASKERIYPVGRLDRNTTGVLLFTNDGELAKKLTHPKYNVKKIYHVMTDQNVSAEDIQKMRDGFELEDGYVKTDDVQFVGDASNKRDIGVEIHSGRNRIVRRMFEHLGYNVVKLDRVMFAGLTKKDLPRGKWRFLTSAEVNFLKNL